MMDNLIKLSLERQASLDVAKDAFLRSGGKIDKHDIIVRSACTEKKGWTISTPAQVEARKAASQKERDLRETLIANSVVQTEFGPVSRTVRELRDKMKALGHKLTSPEVEQLCARYGITSVHRR